jgi:hypothetical protein
MIKVYCDASGIHDKNKLILCVAGIYLEAEDKVFEDSFFLKASTQNAEAKAVLKGIQCLRDIGAEKGSIIYTDCKNLIVMREEKFPTLAKIRNQLTETGFLLEWIPRSLNKAHTVAYKKAKTFVLIEKTS